MGRVLEAVLPTRMGTPFRWLVGSTWVGNLGDGIGLAAGGGAGGMTVRSSRDPFRGYGHNGRGTAARPRVPGVSEPLMILVAGPYRSGSDDDPDLIAANHRAIQVARLEPIRVGDAAFGEVFHPMGRRLVARCDGVRRLPGASAGSDEMVQIARSRRIPVWASLDEIPPAVDRG